MCASVCEMAAGSAIWRWMSLRIAPIWAGNSLPTTRSRMCAPVIEIDNVEEMAMNTSRHTPMLSMSLARMARWRNVMTGQLI